MRRLVLSVVAVGVALMLQLTVVNRLHLPGGAVPDLVLVVVVALALIGGPASGAVTGFLAGLSLDLAPPASTPIGQYALVFCLVGWACGKMRAVVARSAVLTILVAVAAAVVGEALVAAVGKAVDPAQVSVALVRQVLPAAALYDVLITPFVLYLVLLAGSLLPDVGRAGAASGQQPGSRLLRRARTTGSSLAPGPALPGSLGLAGMSGVAGAGVLPGLGSWLAGPPDGRRARRKARRGLRFAGNSPRPGQGWSGGPAAGASPAARGRTATPRLRPGSGVAGSAAGAQFRPAPAARPGRPARVRFSAGGRGTGPVSGMRTAGFSGGSGGVGSPGRALGGRRRFRPGRGERGGSSFAGPSAGALPSRPVNLRFRSAGRRAGVVGGGALTVPSRKVRRRPAAPRFRLRADRLGGAPAARQQARIAGLSTGKSPRLRLGAGRRRDGILGGGALSGGGRVLSAGRQASPRFRARPLAGAPAPSGRRPRFSRRRRRILSVLRFRRQRGPSA